MKSAKFKTIDPMRPFVSCSPTCAMLFQEKVDGEVVKFAGLHIIGARNGLDCWTLDMTYEEACAELDAALGHETQLDAVLREAPDTNWIRDELTNEIRHSLVGQIAAHTQDALNEIDQALANALSEIERAK